MGKQSEPFQGAACAKLERILELEEQAKLRRKDLFDARDHADEELSALKSGESPQREHLEADYGRCVREIKRWDRAIKAMDADLRDTIKGARQLTLRQEDSAQLKIDDYLNAPAKPEDDEQEGEDPDPGAAKLGRLLREKAPAPTAPEFAAPEGEDQHLVASVNELDLRENLKGKLIAGGFATVGQVAKLLDGGGNLDIEGIGEVGQRDIAGAVKKYRKAHRAADREREGELAGA